MLVYSLLFVILVITVDSKKDCVFLHGSGQKAYSPPTTTFTDYWGKVHEYSTQCATTVFVHADTLNSFFDDPKLMQTYADITVAGSLALKYPMQVALRAAGPRIIRNKIVFAHSLGNLVLAAAIKKGLIEFDPATSTWYDISGPSYGSPVADFLGYAICENNSTNATQVKWIAGEFGMCSGNNVSASYFSLKLNYPGLYGIPQIIQKYRTGVFCGNSAWGMLSRYSIPLQLVSALVPFGEDNDGLVGMSACTINTTVLGVNPIDLNYVGKFNHADVTCRNGGDPCKWYSYRN